MLHRKTFVKKTRKGQVRKVVREHYLRDDIWSGSPLDPDCDASAAKLSASAKQYLVVDTNIALQQVRRSRICSPPSSQIPHLCTIPDPLREGECRLCSVLTASKIN